MLQNFFKSRFAAWTGIVLLLFAVYLLGREFNKKYRIQKEIGQLEEEVARLQSGNQEIFDLINYLKTPEFQERQARPLLNLQKPGEFAVALPPQPEEAAVERETPRAEPSSNLKLWRDYFFRPK